ncbi:MAG: CARDB domain-containing protein [Bacteroidota bacterium]
MNYVLPLRCIGISLSCWFWLMCLPSIFAQDIQLGSGAFETSDFDPSPINTNFTDAHLQIIYTAAEINAAGAIGPNVLDKIGFYIAGIPDTILPNYTIKMKNTSLSLPTTYDSTGLAVVYGPVDYLPTSLGFDTLTLNTPFNWDGTSNILVDICFGSLHMYYESGRVRYYPTTQGLASIQNDFVNLCQTAPNFFPTFKPQLVMSFGSPPADEAGLVAFEPSEVLFGVGSYPIQVILQNNGTNPLTSATLNWSIDQVAQPAVNWTGSLASGDTTVVVLGTFTFAANTPYDLAADVSLPNGQPDPNPLNDSISVSGVEAGISGVFTIGGSSPDYTTFAAAIQAVSGQGVVGPVIFQVRPGSYSEQIVVPDILGADCNTPIIFESETGDSTDVLISFSANAANNYTILLDGADGIIFRHMTMQSLNASTGIVLELSNGCTCVELNNNRFIGIPNAPGFDNRSIIYSDNGQDDDLHIHHNRFEDGAKSIRISGQSFNDPSHNTLIEYNRFVNPSSRGMEIRNQESPVVAYNTIVSPGSSVFAGIEVLNSTEAIRIFNNEMDITGGGRGIRFWFSTGGAGTHVFNNFIRIGGTTVAHGLNASFSNDLRFAYNNVRIDGTLATGARAVYLESSGSNIELRNNVLAAMGGGHAIYVQNASVLGVSDHNDLYTTGSNLGFLGGNQMDLAAWQSASSQDANSLSVDPLFTSNTDLHVAQSLLNAAGTPIADVLVDIDGESRNAQTPDIGADEFFPVTGDDAGISQVNTPVVPFASGSQSVSVTLTNFGQNILSSVDIQWEVNGQSQPVMNWTGSLAVAGTEVVVLGNFSFGFGTAHDIKAWVEIPNGQADEDNNNDSLTVANLYAGLNGTYTIGGSSPDFATIQEAADLLGLGGVLGLVTMNIRTGSYTENVMFAEIPGASFSQQVSFQSETGDSTDVIWTGNGNNRVLLLDGTDYVQFKSMSISSGGIAPMIELKGGAHHNQFLNNVLTGAIANTQSFQYATIYSPSSSTDSANVFQNNRIQEGSFGIFLLNKGGQAAGGTVISHNEITDAYAAGISLKDHLGPHIETNIIRSTSDFETVKGIHLERGGSAYVIQNNQVDLSDGGYALHLHNSFSLATSPGQVINNFFHVGGLDKAYGIYVQGGTYPELFFNNVHISSTDVAEGQGFRLFSANNVGLRNNIFANSGGGYAMYRESNEVFQFSDHNNLFTSGTSLAYFGSDQADLAGYQAASMTDANSLSVDPLFVSASDLHIQQIQLGGTAQTVSGITLDIDGELRDANSPDIGADEGDFLDNDLGITSIAATGTDCDPATSGLVTVLIQNYGVLDQTGFDVSYVVDGGMVITENVGSLLVASGDTASFQFSSSVPLPSPGTYQFSAWTSLSGEQKTSNDSLLNLDISKYSLGVPVAVSNMLPADSALDLYSPINFSWIGDSIATGYDLYIWLAGQAQPSVPAIADVTQFNVIYDEDSLQYGMDYQWQVVAKTPCFSIPGPTQLFTTRFLSDLVVSSITGPPSAFSGQEITLSWQVNNQGAGSSGNQTWGDAIFLSNAFGDQLLTVEGNASALSSGQSYSNTATVTLPQGISGSYVLELRSDFYSNITEEDEDNNIDSSQVPIAITLTAPPDLKPISLNTPSIVFSGQPIGVQWSVENQGTGTTIAPDWNDYLYISDTSVWVEDRVEFLGAANQMGPLSPFSIYNRSDSVIIPNGISGDWYIYLVCDADNDIYEHTNEGNNIRISDTIQVVLTPPSDLVVSAVNVPSSVSAGNTYIVDWTVLNQGGSDPFPQVWLDRVYLSASSTWDSTTAMQIGVRPFVGDVNPSQTYTNLSSITLPSDLSGQHYLYVKTDDLNGVYEFTNEGNNVSSPVPVNILLPDISPVNMMVPAGLESGEEILLQWSDLNPGPGDHPAQTWADLVVLSSNPVYQPGNGSTLGLFGTQISPLGLMAGDSVQKAELITLPDGISGTWYLHLLSDHLDDVLEEDELSNNMSSLPITVQLAPWADLQVNGLVMNEDSLTGGDLFPIQFTVVNNGAGIADDSLWTDIIAISAFPSYDSANSYRIAAIDHLGPLGLGASYQVDTMIRLDREALLALNLDNTQAYLHVIADGDNDVYEHTDEGNNGVVSSSLIVQYPPRPDLLIEQITVQDSALTADQILFSWQVKNAGVNTDAWGQNFWEDSWYLSADSSLDSADLLIHPEVIYGPMDADQSYARTVSVDLPQNIFGDQYVILHTDQGGLVEEEDQNNNIDLKRDSNGDALPLHIELAPPSDLKVMDVQAPQTGISGQPITVAWTISNEGIGQTLVDTWTDRIFLSSDFVLDSSDIILGSYSRSGGLNAGETYTDSLSIELPIEADGNYLLLLKTDQNDALYEHQAESNNLASRWISILQPPPSDLVVSQISLPDSAVSGDSIQVHWTVRNDGNNPAFGMRTDALYFSKDKVIDVDDVRLLVEERDDFLAAGDSIQVTATALLAGLEIGNYFLLATVDVLNNIYEVNDTNNVGGSTAFLKLSVPELIIDSTYVFELPNDKEMFFRIDAPMFLQDETMLLSLLGDSLNGDNELYVKPYLVPSRFDFRYKHENAFSGNQTLVIPSLRPYSYYVMLRGKDLVDSSQMVSLRANIIPFEIRSLDASEGGNTGRVTVRMKGGKFTEDMTVWLEDANQHQILADTLRFVDAATVFPTFDLENEALGMYDVYASKMSGDTVMLDSAFEVVPGSGEVLLTSYNHQATTRPNRVVPMEVVLTNGGNIDLPAPKRAIISVFKTPLAERIDLLSTAGRDMYVELFEPGGPQDVLRPGVSTSKVIYTFSSAQIRIIFYNENE